MSHKLPILLFFFCLCLLNISCQSKKLSPTKKTITSPIQHQQIKTDSLFDSHQAINIFTIEKTDLDFLTIEFGYEKTILKQTSLFAKNSNALAAINGTFYDMDNGGSATYLEKADMMIHPTRKATLKYAISTKLDKGAIIINKKGQLSIQPAQSDHFYQQSKAEKEVMVGAPMLLQNGIASNLPDMKFIHNRHPRTCICEREKDWLFITIDGRHTYAHGMSLTEVQQFLLEQNCINALNLDGGGSTTMWVKGKGVVNTPSDLFGERKVANVLMVKER